MTERRSAVMAGSPAPTEPRPQTPPPAAGPRWWDRLGPPAWLVLGVAVALLVVADGSPGWRVVRVLAVAGLTAGGWWLARRRSTGGALASFVAGATAIASAGAIGVRHVLETGPTFRSVAGLVSLAAGGILVACGGAGILHRLGRPGRIVAVPVMVVSLALVAWVVAPPVVATNLPAMPAGRATPADRGVAYEDVTLRTADGLTLAGWYVPSGNGAAVVLRHGAGSTKDDTLDHLVVLAGSGFGVLATDARGHGGSEGRAMDFGWYGDADIRAAVDLLATRPEVDPGRIGVVGLSMGGEEAIGAAAADSRIAAVVAEGATGRTAADKAWLSEAYGVRGTLQRGIEWVQSALTDLLTSASMPTPLPEAIVAASPTPVLLVAGDLPDEVRAGTWLRSQSPDRVTLWVVPGAGHTGGLETAPDAWRETVVGFLSSALGTD
jgi:uncharacterized protein